MQQRAFVRWSSACQRNARYDCPGLELTCFCLALGVFQSFVSPFSHITSSMERLDDLLDALSFRVQTETTSAPAGKTNLQSTLEKQDSAFLERSGLENGATTHADDSKDTFDNRISAEYSTSESLNGRAASLKTFGPPKPICNEARLANMKELGVLNRKPGDPQIREPLHVTPTQTTLETRLT